MYKEIKEGSKFRIQNIFTFFVDTPKKSVIFAYITKRHYENSKDKTVAKVATVRTYTSG
jgi:hypothetical protein